MKPGITLMDSACYSCNKPKEPPVLAPSGTPAAKAQPLPRTGCCLRTAQHGAATHPARRQLAFVKRCGEKYCYQGKVCCAANPAGDVGA